MGNLIEEDCRECAHFEECYPRMRNIATSRLLEFMKAMVRRDGCVNNDKYNFKRRG